MIFVGLYIIPLLKISFALFTWMLWCIFGLDILDVDLYVPYILIPTFLLNHYFLCWIYLF